MMESILSIEEEVILILTGGSHYEIYPIYEKIFDYAHSSKKGNFKGIFEMKAIENEILEIEECIRSRLKKDPVRLEYFEECFDLALTVPRFIINLYENNKLDKSYKKAFYEDVELYIREVLRDFGITVS